MSRSLTLLLAGFMLFISCQKEVDADGIDTGGSSGNASNGMMKAKINGVQWTATQVGASRFQGFIQVIGIAGKKSIAIYLADSALKRYTLSDMTPNAASYLDSTETSPVNYTTNQGDYPDEAGGEVTVTSINTDKKTISGTFTFKVFRLSDDTQKTITEGSFTNIPYVTSLPPASAKDTFQVKIDGASFTPTTIVSAITPLANLIAINATNSTGIKAVGLMFPSDITPGSYTMNSLGGTYIGQYNPDADPFHAKGAVSGTLTIIEHNKTTKRVRGNFNFRGEEILNPQNFATISDGYFAVSY